MSGSWSEGERPAGETAAVQQTLTLDREPSFKIVDSSGKVEHYEDGSLVAVTYRTPSRAQPGWSCAGAEDQPSVHHHSDAGLARLATQYRRDVEDGKPVEKDLQVVMALQYVRRRLRMRYGARDVYGAPGDQGTDVRHQVEAHGEPPSYALAFTIDRERFDQGKPAVVAWGHQ